MLQLIENFQVHDNDKLIEIAKFNKYAYSIERLPGGNSSVLISKINNQNLFVGNYAVGDYITEKTVMGLQSMTEDIYWEQCAAIFRKSSPFLPYFNQLIFRLKDSGLLYAFETQVILFIFIHYITVKLNVSFSLQVSLTNLNFLIQQRVKLSEPHGKQEHGGGDNGDDPVILRISDLQGILTFWGCGITVSCIAFVLEWVYFRSKAKNY